MPVPEKIALMGREVAIRWSDGTEDYYPMDFLRGASPSAENKGEPDLLGRVHGGTPGKDFTGVTVVGWQAVGGYAVQFKFSDGHSTGIYSYGYLKDLAARRGGGGAAGA